MLTLDQIKSQIKMPDVLKRYGIYLNKNKCICPFHNEKTPSFKIYKNDTMFKCFGCGVYGDVVDFVMQMDNCDFQAALQKLGGKAVYKKVLPNEHQRKEAEQKFRWDMYVRCLDLINSKKPKPVDIDLSKVNDIESLLFFADDEYVKGIHKLPMLEMKVDNGY